MTIETSDLVGYLLMLMLREIAAQDSEDCLVWRQTEYHNDLAYMIKVFQNFPI